MDLTAAITSRRNCCQILRSLVYGPDLGFRSRFLILDFRPPVRGPILIPILIRSRFRSWSPPLLHFSFLDRKSGVQVLRELAGTVSSC